MVVCRPYPISRYALTLGVNAIGRSASRRQPTPLEIVRYSPWSLAEFTLGEPVIGRPHGTFLNGTRSHDAISMSELSTGDTGRLVEITTMPRCQSEARSEAVPDVRQSDTVAKLRYYTDMEAQPTVQSLWKRRARTDRRCRRAVLQL